MAIKDFAEFKTTNGMLMLCRIPSNLTHVQYQWDSKKQEHLLDYFLES
jgi:hypothetical protein